MVEAEQRPAAAAGVDAPGPLVQLHGVTKRYGRHMAVADATLTADRGEFLALVGPNGAGKTTLLRILAGLVRPTSGSVRVGGQLVDGLSPSALGRLRLDFFGFVFQSYNLIPTLNAWENVALALDLKRIRGRIAEPSRRVRAPPRYAARYL